MEILNIIDEDFINYKKPSMNIIFPYCTLKCDKEYGSNICQNSYLLQQKIIHTTAEKIIQRYLNNPITKAVVCIGMEPFDSWYDLRNFIDTFRYYSRDDIVIYTGYTEEELSDKISWLMNYTYNNKIIIKFGRYIPNQESHIDPILQVSLSSSNQYARII